MSQQQVGREALTSRVLPQMILSSVSNPLTVTTNDSSLSPAERAGNRFKVSGNAIVTGGAGDLGLETARALLEHGCSAVCLFDLGPSFHTSINAITALCTDFPNSRVITLVVDVTNENAVADAVEAAATELGAIHILLCFAGVVSCVHSEELTAVEWRRVLDINTTGSWFCAQAVGRRMISQGTGGSIIFTASISAHRVNFPQPQIAYNVSKGALLQLRASLAAEWARHGIRVNSISPGYMDTILNAGEGLEEARKIWLERIPMGRMGDPSELVGAIVMLCSPAGKYITGADIVIDGGSAVF